MSTSTNLNFIKNNLFEIGYTVCHIPIKFHKSQDLQNLADCTLLATKNKFEIIYVEMNIDYMNEINQAKEAKNVARSNHTPCLVISSQKYEHNVRIDNYIVSVNDYQNMNVKTKTFNMKSDTLYDILKLIHESTQNLWQINSSLLNYFNIKKRIEYPVY